MLSQWTSQAFNAITAGLLKSMKILNLNLLNCRQCQVRTKNSDQLKSGLTRASSTVKIPNWTMISWIFHGNATLRVSVKPCGLVLQLSVVLCLDAYVVLSVVYLFVCLFVCLFVLLRTTWYGDEWKKWKMLLGGWKSLHQNRCSFLFLFCYLINVFYLYLTFFSCPLLSLFLFMSQFDSLLSFIKAVLLFWK